MKHHFDKLGHVLDQVVVDALMVEHNDGVNLEGLGNVLDLVVALSPDPVVSIIDNT